MFDAQVEIGINAVGTYLRRSFDDVTLQLSHCGGSSDAISELESKLRLHYGMRYALCVSNATAALYVLGLALELKNCEFVTTPFTYGATIAGMLALGNRPQFADIDPLCMTLDPVAAERAITNKTKAIVSVDIFGIPSDGDALRQIADRRGLWLISDSSQSFGAIRNGSPAGAAADALVVSFTAGKTLFAGEGGAIVTNNLELYQRLVYWSQHPLRQRRELGLLIDNEFAFNARISPLSAVWANAMFDVALRKLRLHQQQCREIIHCLNESDLTETIDFESKGIRPTFFRLAARWKAGAKPTRLRRFLKHHNLNVTVEPLPIRLLYKQPYMRLQRSQSAKPIRCIHAERQILKGFAVAV
jgi:perosamine synthetase